LLIATGSFVYQFRSFYNSDPPLLTEIWNAQPRQRGLAHPITTSQFEDGILSKSYFDRHGLIVALRDGHPVGFAHAGFGPSEDGTRLDTEFGVTCMLMVRPEEQETTLGAELLTHSETYLRERGAKVLYGGGIRPLNPFYLGYYGGSELPGILCSDVWRQELFRSANYAESDRVLILHCDLRSFRPPINRQQLLLKRSTQIAHQFDPASAPWWTACTLGILEPVRFDLVDKLKAGVSYGHACFWTMEPLAQSWGVRAAGMVDLEIDAAQRRRGLATCLLSESFRQIQLQGFSLVEAQVMQSNEPAIGLYRKLGFVEIDHGTVLRKQG
jgi:ribosomal protein S18 acetylase RimI-like enzyme